MPTATTNVRRVLFVDDDPQFLETIKGLMMAFSGGLWDVSIADSASSAFGVLQDQAVDMIVIDVQMGVMDGVQMLSLLNRGYPNVQKVVLTGLANEKYRAACLSNGAELFLEKPTNEKGWENLFTLLDELTKFKPEDGFRGVLRRVGIQDVLQMECLARSSSVLEISNQQTVGQIFVENGQIVHAQIGEASGEEAFNRLLGFSGGQFNLKPFKEPAARSISGPWEFLIMEAARKRDEATEAQAVNAPLLPATSPADEAAVAQPMAQTMQPAPDSLAPPEWGAGRGEGSLAGEPQPSALDSLSPPERGESRGEGGLAEKPEASSPQPSPPSGEEREKPPASLSPSHSGVLRPKVEEFLICSPDGEVLHQWQCRNVDVWVSFFEFLSQRAQRIEQLLPLGDFERLEIQSATARAVVIIGVDKGVMVKTRPEPVAAP